MADEQQAAEQAATERRDAIMSVRAALDIAGLERKLADLGPIDHHEARVWVDAIRAGVSALAEPPAPPEVPGEAEGE